MLERRASWRRSCRRSMPPGWHRFRLAEIIGYEVGDAGPRSRIRFGASPRVLPHDPHLSAKTIAAIGSNCPTSSASGSSRRSARKSDATPRANWPIGWAREGALDRWLLTANPPRMPWHGALRDSPILTYRRFPLTGGALVQRGVGKGPDVARMLAAGRRSRGSPRDFPGADRTAGIADAAVAISGDALPASRRPHRLPAGLA